MSTVDAMTNPNPSHEPIEVAFPLPKAPHTNVHLQLTDNGPSLLLFLTTTTPDSPSVTTMGSFVFAMPNVSFRNLENIVNIPNEKNKANEWLQRVSPADTLSTPLFTNSGTLDFATRLSKLLARRTGKPVYVGNSTSFASAGMGGTVEEELEGVKRVVEVVTGLLENKKRAMSTG